MIYNLKQDLVLETSQYKETILKRDTVGLSYVELFKNPIAKKIKLALVAVSKEDNSIIETLVEEVYVEEAYDAITSVFNTDGTLTSDGLAYCLDNVYYKGNKLNTILDLDNLEYTPE